ncbi:nucleotide sugar dehydrogenase [Aneurinibacillus thermoaerophilus]|uniref:Nucleotide sugar dehydrogenase n=1 Tax=Aneurinibacillus thermoaerophilus TaxID=143495 RepID=A0A1G7ZYZ1_ANETH|nr:MULTISPECIES: nucleotide sugar dehydrogenase [Aneurinibacillus]AMA71672.1 UDP-N-acetyl-D-glucosamine dehydrogenase [Aneurinibacillus sp. XH2]MED0676121.1 nucleotide sugar dehydrogenase [Aneurinibacillus thermoaerophilus]MED0680779.1 nucleotide sugar dehydrogenase [Aneurinibacillus thermoaerophilus]MED0757658.1 nucleotide sugar dehydrogenase [Aneurinibacillus thermoaerophilus]MED0759297.1 nucleotide sugar dehydrogenase [Aneurinibacillus thermoaerophilus]
MTQAAAFATSLVEQFIQKIEQKTAVIGVVGLGYVGLPLAVEKAKAGFNVIGFDVQASKVEMVNQGINYIGDVVDDDLREIVERKKLRATSDYSFINEVDAVAICVPTPLDTYQQPDTSYVESSAREVAKYLHPGMLVVLESTTYPGTTEELLKPILEESGLVCGKDFFLAYSPERVDPGNKQFNTKNTPKVVGGVTPDCTKVAASMYRAVLDSDVHEVSSPAVAELEKIYENTFRHINIALANEMAILCNKMGINVWEMIDAAKTKPYGFMAFYPGPGLGGHCIPIDPFYLTWKAREYNYHTRLIELAGEINRSMPEFVTERAANLLNQDGKPLKGSTIHLLGVAYKKDIDDIRESPVLHIIDILEERGAHVVYSDPHVLSFKRHGKEYESVDLTEETLKKADLVVITTDHTAFDYDFIGRTAYAVLDTRNALKNAVKPKRYEIL